MNDGDVLRLAILILGTILRINESGKIPEIKNIRVTSVDFDHFELKWDPISYDEWQSNTTVRYTVLANVDNAENVVSYETRDTKITFDAGDGKWSAWIFTVSADVYGRNVASGTRTYRKLTPPDVLLSLSAPFVNFTNDCQHLLVNLMAPQEMLGAFGLKYVVDFTSIDKRIPEITPDKRGSTRKLVNITAPATPRNICVEAQYRIRLKGVHFSPVTTVCATCGDSDEITTGRPAFEKWILITFIVVAAIGGSMLCFITFMRKYLKKHQNAQLPETIKRVISIKLRDAEGNTADMHHYESRTKVELMEYEEEPPLDDNGNENSASTVSNKDTEIAAENVSLLESRAMSNSSETDGDIIARHQDTDQSRLKISLDTADDDRIFWLNNQIEDSIVSYMSQPTNHKESGYCKKYSPKHFTQNTTGNDTLDFSESVKGGYILKTCG